MSPEPPGPSSKPDVVIVGGGVAGLSAAVSLVGRGVRVQLLEARSTLGGRVSTFTDPVTSERIDNGQHLLTGSCHETLRFLKAIGAERGLDVQAGFGALVIDSGGRELPLRCPPLPAPLHLAIGLARWNALSWADRAAAVRILPAVRQRRGQASGSGAARSTVREWLTAARQTPRLIEVLWEPLATAVVNQSIDVAMASTFVDVLGRMLTRRRLDSSLAFPARPLDELFAIPARRFIEQRGSEIRTSTVVRDVEQIDAKAIVCAVPWHALPGLFPRRPPALEPILRAAEGTAAAPIVTVDLWLDGPVLSGRFVGLLGRNFQWAFDAAFAGAGRSHLSLIASAADALVDRANDDLIALAMGELASAIPAVSGLRLRRGLVIRERRATFSVSADQPRRPATRTPLPGLFLAGDWIDTGLPATIESAVTSGHAAADAAFHFVNS